MQTDRKALAELAFHRLVHGTESVIQKAKLTFARGGWIMVMICVLAWGVGLFACSAMR